MTFIEERSLTLPFTRRAESRPDRTTGDVAAVAALVETWSPLLFRVAHSILRSPAEAEDAVQDTFVRVLEQRRSLAEVNDLRVWLVRITWNLALDRRRRIRPDQLDAAFAGRLTAANLPADLALEESRRMQAVLLEIDRLPAAERHVLLLSAIDELPTAEIAAVLGRSPSAVRALLSRARTRLRERLVAAQSKRKGQS